MRYRIVVAGRLSPEWGLYFEGWAVRSDRLSDGTATTVITGAAADQAALHGLLSRIRDVGLPLLEVVREAGADPR